MAIFIQKKLMNIAFRIKTTMNTAHHTPTFCMHIEENGNENDGIFFFSTFSFYFLFTIFKEKSWKNDKVSKSLFNVMCVWGGRAEVIS